MTDLRRATTEELLRFVFDRPPMGQSAGEDWWWAEEYDDVTADPHRQVRFLLWICQHPDEVAARFSAEQVEQGFWYMFGAAGQDIFSGPLWDAGVPWHERSACIHGLASLYSTLFARLRVWELPYELPFMLWDLIGYGYDGGNRDPAANVEDRRVQQAIFEALSQMLSADHPEVQRAALHGIGHLRHPEGNARIEQFLARSDGVEPYVREYAEHVLEGNVL